MLPGANRTILVILAALVAVGILVLVFAPSRDARHKEMRQRINALMEEAQTRATPRSVLRGKPLPGNAWDEYRAALDDGLPWEGDANGRKLAEFAAGRAEKDRALVDRLLDTHAAAIDHLRLGTQMSEGQYPYEWGRGMEIPSLLQIRRVSSLALAQANILARNGRPQEATELLLDVTVFARDLSANGVLLAHLIGLDIYSKTLDGLRDLILSGKMDRKNLADLAKKLETVDRDFPGMGPTMANETLAYGINLLHYIEGGLPPEEWWTSIKEAGLSYRFFSQKMALGAFESRYDYLERSRKFDQMEFSAVMKESNAIMAEAEASWNPLLRIGLPSLPIILTKYRETQARLRLLRAAAVVLATGEVQSIPDPFGKDLSYIQKAGKLRIQSERQDISLEISK